MATAPTLSTTSPVRSTSWFHLGQFGFAAQVATEHFAPYYYPTPATTQPGGTVKIIPEGSRVGDFNGDGYQDLLVNWYVYPHAISGRATNVPPSVFLNDGQGHLGPANAAFDGPAPARHMTYRPVVADFNGDGRSDYAETSMGTIVRKADGTYDSSYEPIVLVLSGPGGKLRDASGNIQGQETAGGLPPGFTFGHDMSVGDVDGDGDQDLYTGKVLLLNDGSGRFTVGTDRLPAEGKLSSNYMMSSAIGDFNGDGKGDIVAAYAEGTPSYVLMSTASGGWTSAALPVGLYGSTNTKVNYATVADVNGDGRPDILLAETRAEPYYAGRAVQILINKGNGQFADETASRIDNAVRDSNPGEGELSALDVDGDGDLDLFDSTNAYGFDGQWKPGVGLALNDGSGHFSWVDPSVFAFVRTSNIAGQENFPNPSPYPDHLIPVNLDNKAGIDYVSFIDVNAGTFPYFDSITTSLYSILSTRAFSGIGGAVDPGSFGVTTYSPSTTGGQIYALYDGLLGRAPDPLGLEYWASALAKGTPSSVLAAGFLGSPEGQARAGGADNATFVTQLFNATLHRAPDPTGLSYWTGKLDAGTSRAEVGVGFALSPEHLANIQPQLNAGVFVPDTDAAAAARLYYTVLGRAPDATGLAYWANQAKAGVPLSTQTAAFLNAPETQAKTGSLSTGQFVDTVYMNALGRHAEADGLSYWTGKIDSGAGSRVDVTTAIGQSPEAQAHLMGQIETGWILA